ncbi:MAG: Crp/Fnr family transcriptional regulator [Candidatus Paceibacteria bacterium]
MSEFFNFSQLFENCFFEHGELIEYKKGQHIVWQKDKSEWVFFSQEGLVRVSFTLLDKSHRIIGYFTPGAVFAQIGSFWGKHDGTLSYIAEIPTKVYRMKRQTFLKCLKDNPDAMQEYLQMTLRNQIFLIDRVVYQGEKGLTAKCVRWLLFMAKYYGKSKGNRCEINVPLTQETAANFLNATRESINVTLRELEKEGYIELATKKITIKKMKELQALTG